MTQFESKKPMFFDMGAEGKADPFRELLVNPASRPNPSPGYFNTAPASLQPKAPSLRERIEHELQNHEHCTPDNHRSVEVHTAEIIGYHRALHWILKLL